MARLRTLIGAIAVVCSLLPAACTETLSHDTCVRHRDRLKRWAEAKGKVDPKGLEDFMSKCSGSVVSRQAAKCMDQATDEVAFRRCLE